MSGHLFITHGDLTALACDAWALPTDPQGWITSQWISREPRLESLVGPANARGWRRLHEEHRLPPDALVRRLDGWTCGPRDPEPWLVDTAHVEVDQVAKAAVRFVEDVADDARARARFGRSKPLLGLPLVGAGAGGGKTIKGDLIEELVRELHSAATRVDVDVALVTFSEAARAAAIAARRRNTPPAWPAADPQLSDVLHELTEHAARQHLVVFAGAGLGHGAGLPDWDGLLAALEKEGELRDYERSALAKLDEPDRAALLDIGLKRAGKHLGEVVRDKLDFRVVSLSHALLAALPTSEAATTNYDELYERACKAAGKELAVLPHDKPSEFAGWILKLHGTVRDPSSIVLTRSDYLSYDERRAALAGVVEAMLLTRHMLFVGFSLRDENFQRIVHQVRNAVGEREDRPEAAPFGTAVLLGGATVMETLWRGDLRCVDVPDARAFELFLDALADRCTDTAAFLLSPHYEGALTTDERDVRRRLLALRADPAIQTTAVGERVVELLGHLDREDSGRALPKRAARTDSPARLRFSIGSGLGPQTVLEFRADGRVHYDHSIGAGWRREVAAVAPDGVAWQRFRRKLDRLAIDRWRDRYEALLGTDGPEWRLEIVYPGGLHCESSGYWSFPPDGDTEPGPEFRRLLTALSELVGGRDVGGVRASARPGRVAREALGRRVEEVLHDGAALERALPHGLVESLDEGHRSVNWLPAGTLPTSRGLHELVAAPWPTWDVAGHAPMRSGMGTILVRVLAHPSELVTTTKNLERAVDRFEHIVEEYKRTTGVPEDCGWFGTFVDVALRHTALAEANLRATEPVRGVLLGLSNADRVDSATWRRTFAEAWQALELGRLRLNHDVLSYGVVRSPS